MRDRVASDRAISFGPFTLLPGQRLLREGDKPVRLGSRALDILIALVERPGELVGKNELIARVWPGTFVEEGNLKFQISALRRALGDGHGGTRYIATSPGQGYRLVVPVSGAETSAAASLSAVPTKRYHNLPHQLTRLIGRADATSRVVARLQRHRLLSIVGPGGIGKTSVALAVAAASVDCYEHGVWLVDLATLADQGLVPSAVAQVLGFEIRSNDPVSGLASVLRDRRLLLALDNCEHVIDAAATLSVAVLRGTADVHILATSRERLGVEGEQVVRLPPLPSSSASGHPAAIEALAFPAVALFVERATERLGEFELTDDDAPVVADICQRLDGIPLAIELAAAGVATFGVRGLAANLNNRFALLSKGHRSGPPRHRTLRATLDWSYDVLSDGERAVLRRLGIFMGRFTLDAACSVSAHSGLECDVVGAVVALVEKSLVAVETIEIEPRLRLAETVRAYALDRLDENGEREFAMAKLALYHRDLLERANSEAAALPTAEWLATYRYCVDDVRRALDWSLFGNGDISTGIALTIAAAPLWVNLSMMAECRRHVQRALELLGRLPQPDPRLEMQLSAALGMSLTYTTAPIPETIAAWTKTLELSKRLGDVEYQLRALRGFWAHHMTGGEYRLALARANEFSRLAPTTVAQRGPDAGDRMVGVVLHYLGDQEGARSHLERHLARLAALDARTPPLDAIRFLPDRRIAAQALLARILWLQGYPDQAARQARLAEVEAEATGHPLTLCDALVQAGCPVAIFNGDLDEAQRCATRLLGIAAELGLAGWRARGFCYQGMVAVMRDDFDRGLPLLRDGLGEVRKTGAVPGNAAVLRVLAMALARAGRVSEGIEVLEEASSLCERHEERWCWPELLRSKGEIVLLGGSDDAAVVAECLFRQALEAARHHGTLSWQLRAALSLARLCRDLGRAEEALELLAAVCGRFSEGFGTADLLEAKRLINTLS